MSGAAGNSGPGPGRNPFSAPDALLGWMEEIAPFGVFTTDTDLRIRSWNRWLANHSGRAAEEMLGHHLSEVVPDFLERGFAERFKRALEGEVGVLSAALHRHLIPLPTHFDTAETATMLQTVRIAPLPDGDRIVGTVAIIEDVTERESHAIALQRQQEHDRLLSVALGVLLQSAEPMHDAADLFPTIAPSLGVEAHAFHLHDPASRSLQLHAATGLHPRQKDTLASVALGDGPWGECAATGSAVYLPSLQQREEPRLAALRADGMRLLACFPLVMADRLLGVMTLGSYRREAFQANELSFLSVLAQYIAIAIERSHREQELRRTQVELQKHAESLETKVQERTARLNETIAQLESFSYTVAHDLRAPIRSLRGYAEVLAEDHADELSSDALSVVGRLRRASDRLDALTRDLLRFSRIAQADVALTPMEAGEVVRDVLLLNPDFENYVVIEPPLGVVIAQHTLLQQCFSNLFDNAVKFAARGVRPRIVVRAERVAGLAPALATGSAGPFISATQDESSARTRPPEGGGSRPRWIRLWVEDNGMGIPEGAHHKIFGIFERVTGVEAVEGTGIGLAIVARAMQRMGGRCGVQSTPGEGSRFWLELATPAG